ncbi:MAG: helix-turn-helix transcriptional regulator [Oscillospiraceae bacterium]|nr:helix-turn-helix transcriptional regulator [Oscillospiraceae bacterium]
MPKKTLDSLTEPMFYVLLAFRGGQMCGIDIAQHIRALTDGRISLGPGTLYTILGKFEDAGFIEEMRIEGRKRTYQITPRGIEAYRAELARLRACVADAEKEGEHA